MRNKKRLEYQGTDGRIYRGRSIKARKRLEERIKHWEVVTGKMRGDTRGYKCPGSMTK